jgi:hypothetical protein
MKSSAISNNKIVKLKIMNINILKLLFYFILLFKIINN